MNAEATVAVVDDTPENVKVLRSLLAKANYKVLCFTDAEAALKAFSKRPPDLVLMDVNMPGLGGCEACRRMKADKDLKSIPVIFISALSETENVVQGFSAGGSDYIVKPFRAEEVLARVDTHVTNSRLQASLRESYEQVLALETMRDNLVHMIIHDIRTPLALVNGYAEMCEKRLSQGHELSQKEISRITEGARRMTVMVEDILSVKQIETSGLQVVAGHFDLAAECKRIFEAFHTLYPKHRLLLSLAENALEVKADKTIILRVIENLLNNALKFTPEGKTVELELLCNDQSDVTVAVRDEGPGVPDEDKQKIFEKYHQLSATNNRYKGSVGLGLTFCKLAVEAHGGELGIEDTLMGGSRFWFSLPSRAITDNTEDAVAELSDAI